MRRSRVTTLPGRERSCATLQRAPRAARRSASVLFLALTLGSACSGGDDDGEQDAFAGRENVSSTAGAGGAGGARTNAAGSTNAVAGQNGASTPTDDAERGGTGGGDAAPELSAPFDGDTSGAAGGGALDEVGGAAGAPSARPFTCASSKSPMFQSQEPLNMRISADFTLLNSAPTEEESGSAATIEVGDPEDSASIAAKVVARGRSRFRSCQVRPFSIKFPEKQKGNLFQHLGKSVKFVTHCVARPDAGEVVHAPSVEAYEQRVVMEHTVYQLLDQLGIPALKSRLVRLTYHDTGTGNEQTHLAFVLEPEDEMAERCGMEKAEDVVPAGTVVPRNREGVLLAHLSNNLILQYDWRLSERKNLIELYDRARNELFYAPYDFDLVSLFRPDYGPNVGRTIQQNRDAFADWLRRNQSPVLFREAGVVVERADAIRSTFEGQPELLAENRELFSTWFEHFIPALRDFLTCEGHSSDPSRPECYIPDQHAALPEQASPIALGELTTAIEPPGDVDLFAVELEAGKLYTLGGKARLELLDQGTPIATTAEGDYPTAFVAPRTGTFHVRASMGDELVVSGLHAHPDEIERYLSLYADDAGNTHATATLVPPGEPWHGRWELSGGEDQDWLLIRLDGPASLRVTFEADQTWGYAEVIAVDAPPGELPSEATLSRGENDLSSLFGGPGEYLLKLNQFLGTPPSAYTVVLE